MNIAIINIRDLFKYILKFFLGIVIVWILLSLIKTIKNIPKKNEIKQTIQNKTISIGNMSFVKCLEIILPQYPNIIEKGNRRISVTDVLKMESTLFNNELINTEENNQTYEEIKGNKENDEGEIIKLPEEVTTQEVLENNIIPKVTTSYGSVKIDNQSDYEITQDLLVPDVEIENKKDILIYHTHTCESYTPSENYEYEMTGNYRTTDLNYSVARVGTELTKYLQEKGFNVEHNTTYHDYPAYSGSYARSLTTVQGLLAGKNTDIVIDLHRDAVRK